MIAVIRVYDAAGNVSETHEHRGGFKARRNLEILLSGLSRTVPWFG